MHGERGKKGAGCDGGTGALTGHLREDAQGLAAGIAVTAKRILRFFSFFGGSDVFFFRCRQWRHGKRKRISYHMMSTGALFALTELSNRVHIFGKKLVCNVLAVAASAAVVAAAVCPTANAGREKVCCTLPCYYAAVRVQRL